MEEDHMEPKQPQPWANVLVTVKISGREIVFSLRDYDDASLLRRLEELLQRFPPEDVEAEEPAATEQSLEARWCPVHEVEMTLHVNDAGLWWSHPTADGECHGT
jgi:hypothetical protein